MTTHEHRIRDLVTALVDERLCKGAVEAVEVREDVDHDGDPVLSIRVVLSQRVGDRDRNLAGIVRKLRPRLAEFDEQRFPLISFISAEDRTEAA